MGIQSAFTNWTIFDRPYLAALFGNKKFPDGSDIFNEIEEIIEFQKMALEVVSEIRAQNLMTFPVLTISVLRTPEGTFVDEDFAKWSVKHNMQWYDSNFFISDSVTSLSNCCRLQNDIGDLYFNSIGGTALRVGSIKVNTINLARISYETDSKEDYILLLKKRVEIALIALDRVRHIIKRNVEKGLLPNFSLDIVDMDTCYNTLGIIGLYEALQKFNMVETDPLGYSTYTKEGVAFAEQILKTIHIVKDNFALDKNYKINLEQVPKQNWGIAA